jgi:hypothetical protein
VTASLTVLTDDRSTINVTLTQLEPGRLTVECSLPLPLGALTRVVQDGNLWLGVVTEYHASGTASIRIEHHLRDTDDLSLLADQFLGKRREEPVKSTAVS